MGVYIKGITIEMLRNAPLEAVENLLVLGDMVEVPEPHGRLVDADALLNTSGVTINITGKENAMIVTQALDSIYQDIKDAPTVLEAESEE